MNGAEPRHLMVGLEGPTPTADEAAWLAQHRPAGVILFSRNIVDFKQLVGLCADLRRLSAGLEIVADHEGGAVSQLAAALGRPPAAWGLGVLDDAGLTARVFEETGRRLVAAGIDRVLAPVADVMTEPRNPVIGARAFGGEPGAVARLVVAAVTGLLTGGVAACVKHWPGHGGSDLDTHRDSAAAGTDCYEGPFAAALEAGADVVMVGHLHLESTAPDGTALPATLDSGALVALKNRLGAGRRRPPLVIADDVTMGGLGRAMAALGVTVPEAEDNGMFAPERLPRAWFDHLVQAGCDRLLVRGIPFEAFPLPHETTETTESGRSNGEPDTDPDFDGGPYHEARLRLWTLGGTGFADPEEDLVWLDLSVRDRWQAAAGATGSAEELEKMFLGLFRSVRRVEDPADLPTDYGRLVVSTHRPLTDCETWPRPVRDDGVCLALGHPSTADELGVFLGPKWRVGALFDVSAEDIAPGGAGP